MSPIWVTPQPISWTGCKKTGGGFTSWVSRWSWAALWPCHIPFVIGLGTVVVLDAMLIGILYPVFGFSIMDTPIESQELLTMFLAAFFIVVGIVRIVVVLMENF